MTEALGALLAYVLVSALGAYFLAAEFGMEIWSAMAGCFYLLILLKPASIK